MLYKLDWKIVEGKIQTKYLHVLLSRGKNVKYYLGKYAQWFYIVWLKLKRMHVP